MNLRIALLFSSTACLLPMRALAQETPQPSAPVPAGTEASPVATDDDYADDGAIVITGQRPRGSAQGDIQPEQVLDARDVRATGATNISELLEALAPQIGSAQGRGGEQPVLLVNGKKVSGLRELRDIPTEAIERVDILPEEVGLKYGYSADQKVVNIVLRERFRSTAVALTGNAATAGGYAGGAADATRLFIHNEDRTTVNLRSEGNGMLTEDERDIDPVLAFGQDPNAVAAARSLLGSKRAVRGSGTVKRTILGDVSASGNGEFLHSTGRSLSGLGTAIVGPLSRRTISDTAQTGLVLDGMKGTWQWSLVGNGSLSRSRSKSDRDNLVFPTDRTRQTNVSGDLTATVTGQLLRLPAGEMGATFTAEIDSSRLKSVAERQGVIERSDVTRTEGRGAVNIDLPISRRNKGFSALGNLTLSANAEVSRFSDFGTLTKYGGNANFSPVDRLNFLASWSREEGAPSTAQLGDPVIETPEVRIFDFTTGETVLATVITGGNPDLAADRRTVTKVGFNWQPLQMPSLRVRADYVRSRTARPVQPIIGPTPALEAAFPERFVRDPTGRLVSADLRPINFDEARKDTIRIGLDFSKSLKSRRPPQTVIDQLREQFRGAPRDGNSSRPPGPPPMDGPPPGADSPSPGEGVSGSRGFGGGRGGGFFGGGGGSRGRLTFSIADSITLKDQVSIGPGAPVIDYLRGDASGAGGGTPRHKVEAQAGWANNGFGARLSADWQQGTSVRSSAGERLRFSPLATVDLRLFVNGGDQPEWVLKHPWLRGTSARFEVKNLFDAKPKVRDGTGGTPVNYQPDLLNPLGRTVMFTVRKLFSPSPATIRREFERDRANRPQ